MTAATTTNDSLQHPSHGLDPCITIVFLLWLVMLAVVTSIVSVGRATGPPIPARTTINPNVAPWWELAVLPRIGRVTAGEIIRYRVSARAGATAQDNGPAFQCPADLDRVRGIGPVTLQRIGPYIDF